VSALPKRSDFPSIILVYPRTGYDFGFGLAPPHSILALAAFLRSHAIPNRVVIVDQRMERDWESLLRAELRAGPLLVGISSMTGVQLKHALSVARLVRACSQQTPVLLGGVHVSLLPEQSLGSDLIDLGIVGDGEAPLLALVHELNRGGGDLSRVPGLAYKDAGRVVVNPGPPPPDLSTLPLDRFEGIDVERYVLKKASLMSDRELDLGETSRGCPRKCGYCYNGVFHAGTWRGLPAAAVIERIRHHVERYRLKSIWLRDDNFFVDVARAAEVIEYVAREGIGLYLPGITIQEFQRLSPATRRTLAGMKGAMLRFGVESGSDSVLGAIGKGITSEEVYAVNRECGALGVIPSYNFMIGFPGESRWDVAQTVGMMKRLKRENPEALLNAVNLYTPYPGTALFERYRADHPGDVPGRIEAWTTFHHLSVKRGRIGRQERRMYENIAEVSCQLSDTFRSSMPALLRRLHAPLRAWFALRWRFNAFQFAPEILLLRQLKKVFLAID
jgi:radical SAM superfamily enzyme YgiQ (UPF0313 family)